MKRILLVILLSFIVTDYFSQNVGIGTTTPTNTLHVIVDPGNLNQDPVRFQGIRKYTTEDSVLVVNPSTGVVKYMPMADVLSSIPPNILDSLILNSVLNNTDTIYNNQGVRDSILSIMMSNSDSIFSSQTFKDSVLSVILGNIDTIFTLTRDSLLLDSTFMNTLRDSINTDDQNIDSLTITGTTLTTYIENGSSANVDLQPLVDSLIYDKYDSIYAFISDSLAKDSSWISSLDSMLSIYGDTIYFNDSSYTLIKDSLLNDTAWLNELQDSINTDNQNIDSLTISGTILTTYIEDGSSANIDLSAMLDSVILSKSDTLYSIISDSLSKDTLWISKLDSMLSIYGDTVYFNDTSYTLVRDSLLKDSLFLDSLVSLIGDSINTDNQNIDSLRLTGTILTTYIESGASAIIDLQPIIDSALANSTGTDDQNLVTPTLTGTVLNTNIENGTSTSINLSGLLDSVIFSKSDTLYSIISDSLIKDTLWVSKLDSMLSIYGDTIYFNDSSYTLVRDSLLNDSLFLDSLVSLIGDSINTDDQNIDSLRLTGTILTTYIESGTSAIIDLQPIIDSAIANSPAGSDNQNLDSLRLAGTILTAYIESGTSTIIDLQPIVDSAVANASGSADSDWDINANGTGLEAAPAGNNTASGMNSVAAGANNTASGNISVTFGTSNVASGAASTALGQNNVASGGASTVLGGYNVASGIYSSVLGGEGNGSSGIRSVVSGGMFDTASGDYSAVSGGWGNRAQSYGEWVGGLHATAGAGNAASFVATDRLFVVGNGTSSAARSNALILYKNGSLEINEAYTLPNVDGAASQVLQTNGSGVVSWAAAGASTDDQNIDSLRLSGTVLTTYIESGASAIIDLQPIVDSAVANASGSADSDWDINANGTGLEGNPGTNIASGTNSIAAGTGNTTSGDFGVSFGANNNTTANYGVSLGFNNDATGVASSVLGGLSNTVSGDQSVIAGGGANTASDVRTTVSGGGSNNASANSSTVSGGFSNNATAIMSTVSGGRFNTASGSYSTVGGGQYNTAQSYGEWVGGVFATIGVGNSGAYVATDRLFVVGNGTSSAARSNALTLYKNGSLEINEAYTLPNVDGAASQVLTTNGSGTVSWAAVAASTDDQTLTLGTGTATTAILDIESSASDITIQAGTGITLSEAGNTLTIASTSVASFISVINNTTILTTDNTEVVFINSTGSTVQVTLPDATTNSGRRVIMKWKVGGNPVTVVSISTVDGSSALVGAGDDIEYMSDGTQWWVIRR